MAQHIIGSQAVSTQQMNMGMDEVMHDAALFLSPKVSLPPPTVGPCYEEAEVPGALGASVGTLNRQVLPAQHLDM